MTRSPSNLPFLFLVGRVPLLKSTTEKNRVPLLEPLLDLVFERGSLQNHATCVTVSFFSLGWTGVPLQPRPNKKGDFVFVPSMAIVQVRKLVHELCGANLATGGA